MWQVWNSNGLFSMLYKKTIPVFRESSSDNILKVNAIRSTLSGWHTIAVPAGYTIWLCNLVVEQMCIICYEAKKQNQASCPADFASE